MNGVWTVHVCVGGKGKKAATGTCSVCVAGHGILIEGPGVLKEPDERPGSAEACDGMNGICSLHDLDGPEG